MTIDRDTVLIIDDERQLRDTLGAALEETGARVLTAPNAAEGLIIARSGDPDLVILDLGLPDRAGIDVCHDLRRWSSVPIVVLSARHAESDKVALLRAGADDYVSKPFAVGEFIARVQAQLRRSRTPQRTQTKIIEVDGLTIDVPNRRVSRDEREIHLTPTEWAILKTLTLSPGQTVTHRALFDGVWGREFGSPSRYLRVYLTHLRRKIERNPATPRIIATEPGVGYRLQLDDDRPA